MGCNNSKADVSNIMVLDDAGFMRVAREYTSAGNGSALRDLISNERSHRHSVKGSIAIETLVASKLEGGLTLLHIASRVSGFNMDSVLEVLTENGLSCIVPDDDGRTPFWESVAVGNESTLRFFLLHRSLGRVETAVTMCDKHSRSAIFIGCANGYRESVRMLLIAVCCVNLPFDEPSTDLRISPLLPGPINCVNIVDSSQISPLYVSVEGGFHGICSDLILCGSDANIGDEDGLRPLHRVADYGTTEDEIERNRNTFTLKTLTSPDEREGKIYTVIKEIVRVAPATPATVKACVDRTATVSVLLSVVNIDINIRDNMGCTPLILASWQ